MNEPPDCSRATIGCIVRDVLHVRKISCHCLQRLLTKEHKKKRSALVGVFMFTVLTPRFTPMAGLSEITVLPESQK